MTNQLFSISTLTPDGEFHLITDGDYVVRASGFGDLDLLRQRLPDELVLSRLTPVESHPYQLHIERYYAGDSLALSLIPHAQSGTEFRKSVWEAISAIPYGQTVSYKQLALSAGSEGAVRAAGTICGLNKLILLVPCHRVLKSDRSIGSYLYGSDIKTSLLRREGAIS